MNQTQTKPETETQTEPRELTCDEFEQLKDYLTYEGTVADFEILCGRVGTSCSGLVESIAEQTGNRLIREGKSIDEFLEGYKKGKLPL